MLNYKELLATIDREIGAIHEIIRDLEGTIQSTMDEYKEEGKSVESAYYHPKLSSQYPLVAAKVDRMMTEIDTFRSIHIPLIVKRDALHAMLGEIDGELSKARNLMDNWVEF